VNLLEQELRRNEKLTDEAGVLAQNEANDDRGAYSSSSGFDDEGLANKTPLSSGCVRNHDISMSDSESLIYTANAPHHLVVRHFPISLHHLTPSPVSVLAQGSTSSNSICTSSDLRK